MPKQWGEKGNFALLAALVLGLLVGFFALVVDVGVMQWTSDREEDVAESAALAAVKELNRSATGLSSARTAAGLMVTQNDPNGEFVFDPNTEVVFGTWNGTTFTQSNDPTQVNAVRVNVQRNTFKNNPVRPLVAGVLGLFGGQPPKAVNVNSFAIAASTPGGSPNSASIFPLGVNGCDLSQTGSAFSSGGTLACGREIVFGDDPQVVTQQCSYNSYSYSQTCFSMVTSPSFSINPSNARIVSLNLTAGDTSTPTSTSFSQMLDKLINCKKGDSASCTAIQKNLSDSLSLSSDRNVLSPTTSTTQLATLIGSQGLKVQVPVIADTCATSGAVATPTPTPSVPPVSYYAVAVAPAGSKQIAGFATLNIREISTGSKRYIRTQVLCNETISGSAAPTGSTSFGTVVQNPGRLVRTPSAVPVAPAVPAY